MKLWVILLFTLFSSLAHATYNKTPIVITDEVQKKWVKVYYNDEAGRFFICEKSKNDCNEFLGGREYTKIEIQNRLEELQELKDYEQKVTAGLVFSSFVGTFISVAGVIYVTLRSLKKATFMTTDNLKILLPPALASSAIVSGSLGVVYQLVWAHANLHLDALERAKQDTSTDEVLVFVDDIDDFIIDLQDALIGI